MLRIDSYNNNIIIYYYHSVVAKVVQMRVSVFYNILLYCWGACTLPVSCGGDGGVDEHITIFYNSGQETSYATERASVPFFFFFIKCFYFALLLPGTPWSGWGEDRDVGARASDQVSERERERER